ncbi:MAG: YgiT-type zinc finger protein [Planctomycetes bacterium]|nr:YgiT-type zinc finger protein [Planctomycetota bacterium]
MEKLTKCPTCGSGRIRIVRRNWTSVFRGQRYTVPRLRFYECPDCHETVFDPDAVDRIEALRPTRSHTRPRAVAMG